MPIVSEDFGRSVINVNVDDAFFVDTNFIIATIDQENGRHEACYHFLSFLLKNKTKLFICETVLTEAMHALGRMIYIENEIAFNYPDFLSLDPQEKRKIKSKIKSNFGNLPKQSATLPKLAHANEKAKDMLKGLVELSIISIIPSNKEILEKAMNLSHEIPLLSSDSIILATALSAEVKGLISLDGDMKSVPINIYTTQTTNDEFDEEIYL